MTRRTWSLLPILALLAPSPGCREASPAGGASSGPAPVVTTPPIAPGSTAPTPSVTVGTTPPASAAAVPATPSRTWSFDADKVGEAPAGFELFKTGGKAGRWVVRAEPGAPSAPNVLAQLDADRADARFATAIATAPAVRDARVSVRCKPIAGKVDQACGLVLRFKDEKNYYLARANALEKDVNVYVVKDGKRASLGGWKGANFGDAWHELRLDAKGERLELYWDGTRVYEVSDRILPDAGRVGVWIKADSVTYFDDLTLTLL